MPLYTIFHPPTAFDKTQKSSLAKAITEVHCHATGTGTFFVHVIFVPCPSGDVYSGGEVDDRYIRINGVIRAGRDTETRQQILFGVRNALAEILGPDLHMEMHLTDVLAERIDLPRMGR